MVCRKLLQNADFASDFLGGQNPFAYFAPVAENIKIAPLSAYDQGCVELIQNAFSDYFQGKVDFDKAKANFETAIKERYPEITEISAGINNHMRDKIVNAAEDLDDGFCVL